jgi:hypothetical protein
MKPSYIILTETGERLDLNQANEFNPNEYDLSYEFQDRKIGFYFTSLYPNESYCYTPDYDGEDEPITATTLAFKAYDETGHLVCEDEGGCGIWL